MRLAKLHRISDIIRESSSALLLATFSFQRPLTELYNSPMFEYTCSPRKTHEPMQNRGEGQGAMFMLQTPDLETSSSIGLNSRLNMIENY